MAQRHIHYEQAFEHYLRSVRIPYVAVDEARKALLPQADAVSEAGSALVPHAEDIKSFDFLIAARDGGGLLIDVKGRRCRTPSARAVDTLAGLETWVTREDIDGLATWRRLFGSGFIPVFVFMYALDRQPPDGLADSLFQFRGRWYFMRSITLKAYESVMRPRSRRWDTWSVPAEEFRRRSRPFEPLTATGGRASGSEGQKADSVAALSGRPYPHPHADVQSLHSSSRGRAGLRRPRRCAVHCLGAGGRPA